MKMVKGAIRKEQKKGRYEINIKTHHFFFIPHILQERPQRVDEDETMTSIKDQKHDY